MHRTEGENHDDNYMFTDGPPGTTIEQNWLNAIQEEICYVIEQAGYTVFTANSDTRTQLYNAINRLVTTGGAASEYTITCVEYDLNSSDFITIDAATTIDMTSVTEMTITSGTTTDIISGDDCTIRSDTDNTNDLYLGNSTYDWDEVKVYANTSFIVNSPDIIWQQPGIVTVDFIPSTTMQKTLNIGNTSYYWAYLNTYSSAATHFHANTTMEFTTGTNFGFIATSGYCNIDTGSYFDIDATTAIDLTSGTTFDITAGTTLTMDGTTLDINFGGVTTIDSTTSITLTSTDITLDTSDDIVLDSDSNAQIYGDASVELISSSGAVYVSTVLALVERSSDPSAPAEGRCFIWLSNGTGKGDDGDLLIVGTAGGTTKYNTLFDHSGGAAF